MDEVDLDGRFSLVFMIKVLSCSTAAGLFPSVLPLLVFLFKLALLFLLFKMQKQLPRGVHRKRCSKNMQLISRRTPMSQCDFNKVTLAWVFFYEITADFQSNFS